jgi:hypothetical protein
MGSPFPPNGVISPTVQKSCWHEAVRAFRRYAFRACPSVHFWRAAGIFSKTYVRCFP